MSASTYNHSEPDSLQIHLVTLHLETQVPNNKLNKCMSRLVHHRISNTYLGAQPGFW